MFIIKEMEIDHIKDIIEIEKKSFAIPWSEGNLRKELDNKMGIYFVILNNDTNEVAGYGGMWHVINEGHITNVAIKEDFRGMGLGSKMIDKLIEVAIEKEMIGITLEVRVSNIVAQCLYKKSGFILEGIRREYYDDNREDAIIMWKHL